MFDIQNYPSFVAAVLIFQLIPGPGTLAILNATARNGIGAGLGAVMGTLAGDFVYMVAAVLGLAAIMKANPLVFQGLQWFGAAYLCWIGLQLLRRRAVDESPNAAPVQADHWRFFRQAFAVSLTNPKVVLFFVAFFPLFLKPDSSPLTLVIMMAHVTFLSLAYQATLVLVGNAIAHRIAGLRSARVLASRLAGTALIGFAIKLAIDNR